MNNREKFEARFQFGDLAYYNSVTNCYRSNGSHNRDLAREIQCKWEGYQAASAESAARIAELEQKLVEISSLMTLWKKGLLTGDELGKSLFVVHESKPAITNTGDKT